MGIFKSLKTGFTIAVAIPLFTGVAFSQTIVIEGKSYAVDTLQSVHPAGPGVKKYSYRLPEFVNGFGTLGKGLIVNVLEVDLGHPYASVEVCAARPNYNYNEERVGEMFIRKTTAYAASGRKPVAVVNADFFMMGAEGGQTYDYEQGRPWGMEVENGMLIQKAMPGNELSLVFDDNGMPRTGNIGFNAVADIGAANPFPLATVNHYADGGELTLFNNMGNAYPTDSAFAWSPHNPSIMVSLSGPAGGWKVNERMEFTVTAVNNSVNTTIPAPVTNPSSSGGKDFNGEGAILVGNSRTSLPAETSLNLSVSGKNSINATDYGAYWDLSTIGDDPYIFTTGLTGAVGNPSAITLTFEYQSTGAISDMQIFYGKPSAAAGVSTPANLQLQATGVLNADNAALWRTFTLNLMEAITVHGWGATGHTLRLDPGGSAGHHLLIRNIKINLSGSGSSSATSQQFLESMNIGATIGIRMNVTLDGQPLPGNKPNICGMDRLILQNGQPAANNWNEAHPRTAMGYSQDRTKAYLITVDGRQSNVSVGVSTRQLADIFRVAGAYTALNLDGGGSTRMEVLGKLANSATENRRVANALMVVTSAPPTDDTKLVLSTKNLELTPGAARQIMTSVCDGNENIVNYLPADVGYQVTGGIGAVTSEGKFTAGADNAEGYIRVSYSGMKDSVHVAVRRLANQGNAFLKSVEPSAGTLSPAFDPAVTSYKILFSELPAVLSITAETADPASTVSGALTNVTVSEGQEFFLTVTAMNGTTRTYRFTVELSPDTGMESLPAGSVRIYPNPLDSRKILHIDLDKAYDNVSVKIYNAAGVPLHAVKEKGQFLRIPLNLPAGMYILQINLDRQIKTSKLVIRE